MAKNPIRRGAAAMPRQSGGSSVFVKTPDGEKVDVVPMVNMDDLISIDQHSIWLDGGNSPMFICIAGSDELCPGCQLDSKPKYQGYLPVMQLNEDGNTELKVFSFGIQVARQLAEIDEAVEGIKGKKLRIKREGKGLQTKYSIVNLGKTVKLDGDPIDPVDHLGPTDREGILKLLTDRNVEAAKLAKISLTDREREITKTSNISVPVIDDSEDEEEWSDVDDE